MKSIKISVITVNLNNLKNLKVTVESILGQTYENYEYIIIDGGSTDGSKEFIQKIDRVDYWISEPDNGIYNAMNKAVSLAKGEYCIFINSGDRFYNEFVLEEIAPLLNGGDFYVGHPLLVDNDNIRTEYLPKTMSIEFLLVGGINHQCTFTKAQLLKDSPYNEHYKVVADYEKFFSEWLLHGRTYNYIDKTISYYQLGGFSAINIELLEKERMEVIEKLIPKTYFEKLERRFDPTTNIGKFEEKLNKSLNLSPLKRDLKIIRNAFKLLIRDILSH